MAEHNPEGAAVKIDVRISGGTVIDPDRGVSGVGEVLIQGNRIIGAKPGDTVEAVNTIRADGCLVVPGLIDFHAHLSAGGSELGISPDSSFLPMGVTTAVDAGTYGSANYDLFVRTVVPASRMRIFSFINVCPVGHSGFPCARFEVLNERLKDFELVFRHLASKVKQ